MVANPPFSTLRRALLRRRLQRIDIRLRFEIAAIALLIVAFLFWQLRLRFAGTAFAHGAAAVDRDLLLILAGLALAGGITAGGRYARLILRGGNGPAWLTLPVTADAVRAQIAWEARFASMWAPLPALAACVAAVGLAHPLTLGVAMGGFVLAFQLAARAGCGLANRWLASGPGGLERRLSYGATRGLRRHAAAPSWRRAPLPLALWLKDALLLSRSSRLRERLAPAVGFALLSAAVWFVPDLGHGAHPIAFALGLLAAGTFGEWILELSGHDPFLVLRSLPVGWPALWLSRMAWVALGVGSLIALQWLAARPLMPSARSFFLSWLLLACLAILALAVHYAQTVFPRVELGQRLYALGLGLAVVGSLLIPLLGWIVLLTAVIHSALRLGRWSRIEDRP